MAKPRLKRRHAYALATLESVSEAMSETIDNVAGCYEGGLDGLEYLQARLSEFREELQHLTRKADRQRGDKGKPVKATIPRAML